MELVRPGCRGSIDHLLALSVEALPTYSEVGATLKGEQPRGYRHDRYEAKLGIGRRTFLRATTGLQTWSSHQVPGIGVLPQATPIELGATVVVTLGTPWLALAAPCRIVAVLDEPDRWGFAYGTLPGHPEQGEESFVVSIDSDEEVKFRITAFSRPGGRLTRLAGPIGRSVQRAGTNGYVKALQGFVDQAK
jgi:uncharacterized protein (UPF0548 family)